MGFNFPDAPTPGQVYGSYTWDAATGAWKLTASGGSGGGGSITVSDTPPASPVAGALWWESDTGNLYIYYNDGDSSQWVLAVPAMSASSIGAVAYTPQTLTAPQQTIARQNVYAAPFDALAYSGMQINGSIDISQETGATGTTAHAKYACDGWLLYMDSIPCHLYQIVAVAWAPGIANLLVMDITTANTAPTGNALAAAFQVIEASRVYRLAWGTPNAKPLTIAFWSAHSVPGLYTGSICAGTSNRSYAFSYTQNAANIAEYKVITIPGCTDGTWNTNYIAEGLQVSFAMAVGTTMAAPSLNTWVTGVYRAGPGQVNGAATVGNALRLTGFVALPGIEAPSASRSALIMRPFDQELLTCQRYWQKSYDYSLPPGTVGAIGPGSDFIYQSGTVSGLNSSGHAIKFGITMRGTPQIAMYSPRTGAINKVSDDNLAVDLTANTGAIGQTGFRWYAQQTSAQAQTNFTVHWTADARL